MESITFKIDERLESAGSCVPLAGHVDLASYSLGNHEFTLPAGIDYDLILTNAGEGILASGMVRCHVVGTCDRCLERAEFDIASEVNEYYLFEAPSEEDLSDDEDEVDYLLIEDNLIDVSEAIMAAVLMETPFVVLCKEDCKGLCPTCGANLNTETCNCDKLREEEALANSPFAALKNYSFGDSDESVQGSKKA